MKLSKLDKNASILNKNQLESNFFKYFSEKGFDTKEKSESIAKISEFLSTIDGVDLVAIKNVLNDFYKGN